MKNRRVWIVAAVVLGASTWGALWWSGRSEYARFVSAPLKDGTRYTFLYPKRMSRGSGSMGVNVSLAHKSQPSPQDSLMAWLMRREASNVVLPTRTIQAQTISFTGGNTVKSFRKDEKKPGARTINIWDARSKTIFCAYHHRWFESPIQFERDDKVWSDSFQILRPGAPVPSP